MLLLKRAQEQEKLRAELASQTGANDLFD